MTKEQQTFRDKKKKITKALETDYKELVIRKQFKDQERTFHILGDKIPLVSFSGLISPIRELNFGNIPHKNLLKVSQFGQQVMENLGYYAVTNELLHTEEQLKVIHFNIIECLNINGFEIVEVEKYFISDDLKHHAYFDIIVRNIITKNYALVEIKTKNSKSYEPQVLDKMQAYFYKKIFYNIDSYLMIVNRNFEKDKEENNKNWKYNFVKIEPKYGDRGLKVIATFYDYENWENIEIKKWKK